MPARSAVDAVGCLVAAGDAIVLAWDAVDARGYVARMKRIAPKASPTRRAV